MAVPQVENIIRKRGDTHAFTVTISDGTSPINISSYSFKLTVDPSSSPSSSSNNLFQLTSSPAAGITITDGGSGVISVALTAGQADQTPKVYFYDLEMTDGSGLITTILTGEWEVVQDITK